MKLSKHPFKTSSIVNFAALGLSAVLLSGCGTIIGLVQNASKQVAATPITPAQGATAAPAATTNATAPARATSVVAASTATPAPTARPTNTTAPRPTSTPLPPTVAPSTLPKATPAVGKANIEGRIQWNGKGVANLPVRLCEDRSTLSDCKGNKQETKTNESGDYRFANVTPGEYTVEAKAFDKPYWIFAKGDITNARKYKVEADKTVSVNTLNIFKVDLQITSPRHKASIKESQPTITWKQYPDADYYELYLAPQQGAALFSNERIYANEPSSFKVPTALLNCKYSMTIVAYNANKIKIAEQEETFSEFTVTGQDAPCEAKIKSPARDAANVPRTGAAFEWESHARASYYKLVLYPANKSSEKILDFVKVSDATTFKLDKALEPGKYNWWVQVFDDNDKHVASSSVAAFTVK